MRRVTITTTTTIMMKLNLSRHDLTYKYGVLWLLIYDDFRAILRSYVFSRRKMRAHLFPVGLFHHLPWHIAELRELPCKQTSF